MKRFKLTKHDSTLWRHARSDMVSTSTALEHGLGDEDSDAFECTFDIPVDSALHEDGEPSSDYAASVEGGGRARTDNDFYDNAAPLEAEHDIRIDIEDNIGWRWVNEDSDSELDVEDEMTTDVNLRQDLADWATAYRIQQCAVGSLLTILKPLFPSLPNDPRTLLKTSTQYTVKQIAGGEYCHVGLFKGISSLLCRHPCTFDHIELQINVDGIPLFKSSNVALWPILCSVINIDAKDPFVIGLFCGKEKPSSAAEFLLDFVTEVVELMTNGLNFENNWYPVVIHSFVCDAPARAFIKGIKCHSGYSSCEKCTAHGEYAGKVIFPLTDAPLRTDESFNARTDEDHHARACPLDPLPIGFVSQFGLDYMHLVCLGVVRRFLLYWKGPIGPLHVRIGRNSVGALSRRLLALVPYVPFEFARKPRSIDEIMRWKAIEFRQFVLYSGSLVLDGVLPQELYDHFMLLFVAMRVLASPQLVVHVQHTEYANKLLIKFVKDAEALYGKEALVYNVHNLVHIAADVERLGCLDKFSAFPFENKLGELKKMVRKPQQPIQQVLKRLDERQSYHTEVSCSIVEQLKCEHSRGPVLPGYSGCKQYKQLKTDKWTVSLTVGNNCVITKDDIPVLVKNIVRTKNSVTILICVKFKVLADAFSFPLASTKLSIFKAEQECKSLYVVPLSDVVTKCVCWPVDSDHDKFIVMPLVH